jgi:S-adenosylmethionine decarboxylase
LLDSEGFAFIWGFRRCSSVRVNAIEQLSLSVAPARRHLGFLPLVGEDGMSQNALLRSGKGLGIPGTARTDNRKTKFDDRKTKFKVASPPALVGDGPGHFAVRNGVRCAGVHLIVDLHDAKRLDDIGHIETTLRRCVEAARATLLHIHVHHFQPNGVSGVAVLAESHISIHTWPDAGYAALDVFMCGSADPDACIPVLREAFSAKHVGVNEILRGQGA